MIYYKLIYLNMNRKGPTLFHIKIRAEIGLVCSSPILQPPQPDLHSIG